MAEAVTWEECRTNFTPSHQIRVERSRFVIKTADTVDELERTLRLRHEVFYREILGDQVDGLDCDRFDALCDHLIIIDTTNSDHIIGTYRLNPHGDESGFYSETEFAMAGLKALPGRKLELGRACVHPDYRRSPALALLWQGLGRYVERCPIDFCLGCSSIPDLDPEALAHVDAYLTQFRCSDELWATALPEFFYDGPRLPTDAEVDSAIAKRQLPPLVQLYLRAGAQVCSEAAHDREFRCLDYLMLLDLDQLDAAIDKRYRQ